MPLIIGTAGHIDHGKTALIRALTGQDTDRLKEEKARGISIDIGFAWLDRPDGQRTGIVDVPGHERFIRNMLAGAHGIDLVLFTVAADDGVMPQTEEHLDILHLLGVRNGIFVVTKTDLVDAARVAAVREEIEILTLDTTLEGAPVVPVSTLTGAGLDELRAEIARGLASSRDAARTGWFRLPVDRAFVMRGHGVVVTGTAVAGTVAEGDSVRILPAGLTARVRGLEIHGSAVARADRGQRVAMNLAGVDLGDVRRGEVVCDPRIDRATMRFDARLEVRPGARRPLANHERVRVHLGTAEVLGRIVLLDDVSELPPRGAGWVQVVLRAPLLALRGDRFVVRDQTARWTLGGGIVVHPFANVHRRDASRGVTAMLARLHEGSDPEAAAALLDLTPEFAVPVTVLEQSLERGRDEVVQVLAGVPDAVPLPDTNAPDAYTTTTRWERFCACVTDAVAAHHRAQPLAPGLDLESVRAQLPWDVPPRVFRWGIERLAGDGRLVREDSTVRDPAHRVRLDERARALGERVEELLAAAGFTPPDVRQLEASAGVGRKALADVLGVLESEGRVIRVAPDLWFARSAVDEARGRLELHCRAHGDITAAVFRDLIGASRKFSIALLDWFDRSGVTLRIGDLRRLRR
jgi:selenocysteine-specific elongation factor